MFHNRKNKTKAEKYCSMLFSFSGQKISFYNACFVLQKKLAILSGKIFTTLKFCLFNNVLTYLFSLSNPNIPPLDLLFHIKFLFFFGTEHTKWFRHFVFGGTFVAAKCIYSNFCSQLHFVSFVAGTFTTYQTDTIREISTSFGNTIVALLTFGRNSSFFLSTVENELFAIFSPKQLKQSFLKVSGGKLDQLLNLQQEFSKHTLSLEFPIHLRLK